jgi:seryl-tRNA synthetase
MIKKFFLVIILISFSISSLLSFYNFSFAQTTTRLDLSDYKIKSCIIDFGQNKVELNQVSDESINLCLKNLKNEGINVDLNSIRGCFKNGIDTKCLEDKIGSVGRVTQDKINKVIDCLESSLPFFSEIIPGLGGFGDVKAPKLDIGTFLKFIAGAYLMNLVSDIINKFIGQIFGKVPTNDSGAQQAIAAATQETAKGFAGQIQQGLQLAIQDSIEYLQYKILSAIEGVIYDKILKNFIPDIKQYTYLRLYQAYSNAVEKIIEPFNKPNISCLPLEVKSCVFGLLDTANGQIIQAARRSEEAKTAIRLARDLIRNKKFEIFNKTTCDPTNPETLLVYQQLGLNPNIVVAENAATLKAYIKEPQILVAKVEIERNNYLANIYNFFANPFKSINLRYLLGQAGGINENNTQINLDEELRKINEITNDIGNCSLIANTSTMKIFQELETELKGLATYLSQPGGVNFKFKSECRTTAAGQRIKSLDAQIAQLEQRLKKLDPSSPEASQITAKISELERLKNHYQQQEDQIRKAGITGESALCVEKGEIKNPISTYEEMKNVIEKKDLTYFLNRPNTQNILVNFVRGWVNSNLFKTIDEGFNRLGIKTSNPQSSQDIAEIYSPKKASELCSDYKNYGLIGGDTVCKNVMYQQNTLLMNMNKLEMQTNLNNIQNILELFSNILNTLNIYSSTTKKGENDLKGILTTYAVFSNISKDYSDALLKIINDIEDINSSLENASSTLNSLSNKINEIYNFSSSSLLKLTKALSDLENSTLTQEINSITALIREKEERLSNIKNEVNSKLQRLQQIAINQRFITLFSLAENKLLDNSKIRPVLPSGYFDYYYGNEFVPGTNTTMGYFMNILPVTRQDLSFYNYFYPYFVINLSSLNNIGDFINNGKIHFRKRLGFFRGEDTLTNPPFLLADTIRRIIFALYNTPEEGVSEKNQKNILTAVVDVLNDYFNGATSSLTQEDINKLSTFFNSLENVSNRMILYVNQNTATFPEDYALAYDIVGKQIIKMNLKETLEYFKTISSSYKETVEFVRNNFATISPLIAEINQLKNRLDQMQKDYDNLYQQAFKNAAISKNVVIEKSNEAENIRNELFSIRSDLSNVCINYNRLLTEFEGIFNTMIGSNSGGSGNSSFQIENEENQGRKFAKLIKNSLGNIFSVFSLFGLSTNKVIHIK